MKPILLAIKYALWAAAPLAGMYGLPSWTPFALGLLSGLAGWGYWRRRPRLTTGRPGPIEPLPKIVTRLDWQLGLGLAACLATYTAALFLRP